MKSLSLSALVMALCLLCFQSADAQCDSCAGTQYNTNVGGCQSCGCQPGCGSYSACDYFKAGYTANVAWPSHFIPPARRGVCDAFAVMANNGWRRQNLLGDYHFEPESNKLTRAGEMKVNWILTQAPVQRRTVYVQRGAEESQTSARLASVENYGGTMSPAIASVDVMDTHIVAEGHRASSVDNIFVGYQENRPPPVLPAANSSAGNSTAAN